MENQFGEVHDERGVKMHGNNDREFERQAIVLVEAYTRGKKDGQSEEPSIYADELYYMAQTQA